jgi:hypothetical protein
MVSGCLAASAAQAAPPADPTSIWTLQDENASISTSHLTDRYYTNGLRLGWTSGTDQVPGFLANLGHVLWGDGRQRIAFDLSQQIYTPADTQLVPPDPHDRPYAGVLLGNFSLLSDTDSTRSVLGLSLGVVGPGAGGEGLQNGFHDLIGQGHALGWSFQIPNTPAIEALSERTWRLPIAQFGALETDALPDLTVGVGDLRDYAQAGVTFRIGQGLNSDFGVARVRPGLSGSDAFVPTRPFAWYIFAGADGQAVAYDLLLQSSPFRGGPHVTSKWDVGEFQGGIAIMAFGARLTYTQIVQTQEFKHQHGGLHQLGSLALSVRF